MCDEEDGEMEVKEEYRGKITYKDKEDRKEHWVMGRIVR
jgi:hypothetical protein